MLIVAKITKGTAGRYADFQYFDVHDDADLSALEWRRGGYRTEDLDRIFTGDDARVLGLLHALDWILLDPGQMRALGFCVSVKHAEYMARAFTDRDLLSVALSGETDTAERDSILRRLEQGELRCVFSVDVLGEGVDDPSVDIVLLLRPTQSATVLTQQIGRGLREHHNKNTPTVVDLIGQQHRRFRFDAKLRALIDSRSGRLVDQVENDFPYLPAGCEIKLDRQSREVILSSLRAAAGAGNWSVLVDDLRRMGEVSLRPFLRDSERSLGDLYRSRDRTWTRLRRDAGLPVAAGDAHQETLLRAIHRLLHIDDADRVETYHRFLTAANKPTRLSERDRRLLACSRSTSLVGGTAWSISRPRWMPSGAIRPSATSLARSWRSSERKLTLRPNRSTSARFAFTRATHEMRRFSPSVTAPLKSRPQLARAFAGSATSARMSSS